MPHNYDQQPGQTLEFLGSGNFAKVYASPDGGEVYKYVDRLLIDGECVDSFDKDLFLAQMKRDQSALSKFGVDEFIPKTNAEWQDGRGIIVQERVFDTVPVLEWGKHGTALAEQLNRLLTAAFTMGNKTFDAKSHQLQMPDMHNGSGFMNVVVGRTASDPTPRVYLLDTHPVTIPDDLVPAEELWSETIITLAGLWPNAYRVQFSVARRAMSDFYRHIREASAIHQSQGE